MSIASSMTMQGTAHLAIVGQAAPVLVDDLIHAAQVAVVQWRAMLARIILQQVQARHLQASRIFEDMRMV